MGGKSVAGVYDAHKCCSCGICAGVCGKECISLERTREGMVKPKVDETTCSACGLCRDICPGLSMLATVENDERLFSKEFDAVTLHLKHNDELLLNTASGGFVTATVKHLLEKHIYDSAFLVDTYNYSGLVHTKCFTVIDEDGGNTGRSRYIPVLHDEGIHYMLHHRSERIVFVGTSCAIHGIANVIKRYKLKRGNYLLLGLFCDKLMSYNVWNYFSTPPNKKCNNLFFRDKQNGGWPGNMVIEDLRGMRTELPKTVRQSVKDFFCSQRCLYCADKLNVQADLSVGDNYTGKDDECSLGSSNVIIRTDIGRRTMDLVQHLFEIRPCSAADIYRSQEVAKKKENVAFAHIAFGKTKNVSAKIRLKYLYKLMKLRSERFPLLMKMLLAVDKLAH